MNEGLSSLKTRSLSNILTNYLNNVELQDTNKLKVGYFTNRVPLELIDALGLLPIRVLSTGNLKQGASEKYIQIFACSWLRQILDIGLSGGYREFDGLIFSAGTCDSLQNVSDIWRKIFPEQWTHNLTFPVLTDTEAAKEFLQNEFERLIETIRSELPTNDVELTLSRSIKKYNQKRALLFRLTESVTKRELNYAKLAKLQLATDILPIESAINLIQTKTKDWIDDAVKLPESPRLLISGGMGIDNFNLLNLPEQRYVVADDLSFGYRNINFQIPEDGFLPRYAESYLNRTPDPTAFDMNKRLSSLAKLIKGHRIDGVVLMGVKWCDPESFEFVPIQKQLKELDIPHIHLETTPDLSNIEQLRTRLSAFVEMIS